MSPSFVGVDIGGSGLRAACDARGVVTAAAVSVSIPRTGGMVDPDGVAALVADTLATLGQVAPAVLCLGLAGFPQLVGDPRGLASAVRGRTGADTVVLARDALTTHVGAFGMNAGTVLSAGTGVAALGTDLHETWNVADGVGMLLGDQGGGAWIGRRGAVAAFCAADGRRGGSEPLLALLRERPGDLDAFVAEVSTSPAPASLFGALAPLVARAATAGDPVATAIWRDAGRLLGETAVAASTGLDPDIRWGGGLFGAGELLLESFRSTILEERPDARILAPSGSSADGALTLAKAWYTGALPAMPSSFFLPLPLPLLHTTARGRHESRAG